MKWIITHAWFYLRFLASEDDNYLAASNSRMYREEYAALPSAAGANEAAVRGGFMPKKLDYFEAQISDIVDVYRESLLKNLPELYEQKVNGFALSVKSALLKEFRNGLGRNLPADVLLGRLEQVFNANAALLEKGMFLYRFVGEDDKVTCKNCSQHDGKIGTAEDFEQQGTTPPLHPNCRCKLEPLAEGPYRGYTESESSYAGRLGIIDEALEELKGSTDLADILFVENLAYLSGWRLRETMSADKLLSALYIAKNHDGETARKLLKDAGFREAGKWRPWDGDEINFFLLAYDVAAKGGLVSELDLEAWKQHYARITQLTALTMGNLVDALLNGPPFNPATGYSPQSALDQLEKYGYLTPAQQQAINKPIYQGGGTAAGNNIYSKNINDLPSNVQHSYAQYNKSGWSGNVAGQTSGTKAGGTYQNSNGALPKMDSAGNTITYREFDINNKLPGINRDAQRFITGSDGSIYYTDSHYGDISSPAGLPPFVKLK